MEGSGGSAGFWGERKTLHIVLAVITFGLWLLARLALYLWREGRRGWSIASASALGGRLYALESITAAGFPAADPSGTGQVVRINPNGTQTTVVTGLTTPTAMTFGPDGALYISNVGFGAPAGFGEVLRAELP